LALTGRARPKRGGEPARDRPGRAGADAPAVELHDRYDLGAGAGEEALLGDEEIVAREATLLPFKAVGERELPNRRGGDAVERAVGRWWRHDAAPQHREHVVGRALGDEALGIQHERLGGSGLLRFEAGEHVLQIVERLDARVDARGRYLAGRGGDDPDSRCV